MERICDDPVRYLLAQTEKKGLFSKKEVTVFAVGDENGTPLTAYEFASVGPYTDGFASAQKKKGGSVLLGTDGKPVLPEYGAYAIRPKNGYLTLYRSSVQYSGDTAMDEIWRDPAAENTKPKTPYWPRGLASSRQEILIDPKKNTFLQIFGDIVLYGNWSTVGLDYCSLGVGRFAGGGLVPVLPCVYNHAEYLWGRLVAVGRYVVNKTTTASSLTKNTVTVTSTLAFMVYDADSGKPVSDLVFGGIHRTDKGNISAVVYPHIRAEELTHRQSVGEAFSGAGLLDFKDPKKVVLNDRFEFPK